MASEYRSVAPSVQYLGTGDGNALLPLRGGGWVARDPVEGALARFDANEAREQTLGTRGAGPGEFGTVVEFALVNNGSEPFLMLDNGLGRVSRRTASGAVLEEFSIGMNGLRLWAVGDSSVVVFGATSAGQNAALFRNGERVGDLANPFSWIVGLSSRTGTLRRQVGHAVSSEGVIYTVDPYTGDARCLRTDGSSWPPSDISLPVCSWSPPEQPFLSDAQRAVIVGHFTSLMKRVSNRLPSAGNDALKQVSLAMNTDLAADRAQRVLPSTPTFASDGAVWVATPWLEDANELRSAVYRVGPDGVATLAAVVDAWVIKILVLDNELMVSAITPEVTTIAWRLPVNPSEVLFLSNK